MGDFVRLYIAAEGGEACREKAQIGGEDRLGGRDLAAEFDGLLVTAAGIVGEGHGRLVPESIGIERRQPKTAFRPGEGARTVADVAVRRTAESPRQCRVGAGGDRLIEQGDRAVIVAKQKGLVMAAECERQRVAAVAPDRLRR